MRSTSKAMRLLVLDSLFDDLQIERAVAGPRQWDVDRWDGSAGELATADAVVHVRTRVDRSLIAKLERCRVIGRFGTGLDSVDLAAAQEAGIQVVRARDYCTPELASHTLALAFGLSRRLPEVLGDRWSTLDLDWTRFAAARPLEAIERAAVVGYGAVGRAVARALLALGIEVLIVTRYGKNAAREDGGIPASIAEALVDADLILLHAGLDESTRGMLGEEALCLVKPSALLVNTARLALLDEHAAARALMEGRLGGLGLDAYVSVESPLRALVEHPRMIVTPHIGWYSERSARVLREVTVAHTVGAYGQAREREKEVCE